MIVRQMKNIFTCAFCAFLALAGLFSSCKADRQEGELVFSVYDETGKTPKSLDFPSEGSSVRFRINSTVDWSINPVPEWLTITPMSSGKGPKEVNIAAARNNDTESRTAKIEFVVSGSVKLTVAVSQKEDSGNIIPEIEAEADLLDVEFKFDGTAENLVKGGIAVQTLSGGLMVNYYNRMYGRYVSHYNHSLGGSAAKGYYKADYSDNESFISKLSDGHSLEVLFKIDEKSDLSKEIKMFSSMQSGGTGFLISRSANGGCITFLPHVGGSWKWTGSGINPEPGRYYHAIGVWDKDKGKSYIYIDGELKHTISAAGDFKLPAAGANWFGIGCDASASGGESAWKGDVAIARVYDKPLTQEEVSSLFAKVKKEQNPVVFDIRDLSMLSSSEIAPGYRFNIYASGFKEGDMLVFESIMNGNLSFECSTAVKDGCLSALIPEGFASGSYRVMLNRGEAQYPLGSVTFEVKSNPTIPGLNTQVVAHRCWHENGTNDATWPENSLAAFKRTQTLGIWGAEIDVWITTDDVVVVNHNSSVPTDPNKTRLDSNPYSAIENVTLSNGEKVPLLDDFLTQMAQEKNLHLVIEIKSQKDRETNNRLVDACIKKVTAAGLLERVVWIAFDFENCKRIVASLPGAMVQYLNGDKTPKDCFDLGIMGIDYNSSKLTDAWISEAHRLGMAVNVWTVNSSSDMMDFIGRNVDYITTNEPDVLKEILSRPFISL